MRIVNIFLLAIAFLAIAALTGYNDYLPLCVNSAYAEDDNSSNKEEENQDEEEYVEYDDSLINILLSIDADEIDLSEEEEEPVEEEESIEEEDPESDEEPTSDEEPASDQIHPGVSELPDIDWGSVPGQKVRYFFLMDDSSAGMDDRYEPVIARLKAVKYADQIYNGIPFRYEISSSKVYLEENMTSIPELIFMVDKTQYVGVVRFDYEVAFDDGELDKQRTGRSVIATASVSDQNLARSFEETRKSAFTDAVISAYSHEKGKMPENQDVFHGIITGWDILNEGWIRDQESFYLQMRVWVKFDY